MQGKTSVRARRWTVFTAVLSALVVVSVAFAAPWTAESNGKAGAKSGRIEAVVATEAAPTNELYPGESADAALTLTNPNPTAMVVTAITGNGAITSSSAACNAAGHGVTFTNQTGSWAIAKNATLDVVLANAVSMGLNSANECQDVSFSIPVRVTSSVTNSGGGNATTTTTTPPPNPLAWQTQGGTPGQAYNMGGIAVGSSITREFILRNTGTSQVSNVVASLAAGSSPDFSITSNACSNTVLQGGEGCVVFVRFAPSSTGVKSGGVDGFSSASPQKTTQSVFGQGITPAQLAMSPGAHNFGSLPSGAASSPVVFTVQNVGQQFTYIDGPRITGAGADHFDILGSSCGPQLAGGQSCQIQVRFRPDFPGSHSAVLSLSAVAGAPGGTATSQLSGTGV